MRSLTSGKINPQSAYVLHTSRFQDPRNVICPIGPAVDIMGRPACPSTLPLRASGCVHQFHVMDSETKVRPNYSRFISDVHLPGATDASHVVGAGNRPQPAGITSINTGSNTVVLTQQQNPKSIDQVIWSASQNAHNASYFPSAQHPGRYMPANAAGSTQSFALY